jgi:hypothetical protein
VVYCGGMFNSTAVNEKCFSLNPLSNSWVPFPSMPVGLSATAYVMTPDGWWITGEYHFMYKHEQNLHLGSYCPKSV